MRLNKTRSSSRRPAPCARSASRQDARRSRPKAARAHRAGTPGRGRNPRRKQSLTPEQQAVIDGAEGTTNADINEDFYPGKEYLDNLWDRWDQVAEEYAPEMQDAA